ncbi:bifunctional isochorismate lyase/aryl carrier protein [Saccharopolyspora lacisalsi]|uniref:Bifunctional isochorismate lyase/aryl carrier protein n=1 Tax=Halosaccharopolyspora lacisalsi TaxID=1000566 RepID=A0A839DYI4_9PSEU|nr:isochorismatase family protein [Halosaccharopolyspora lacisalsi]MBA8824425.1 bifunctional isochorismate lyase/aryl carrier protein [Halosaccharopolyspora lacisalsi]
MALPAIAPYSVPRQEELPADRVDWRLEPDRAVLLVHDMERHFVDAFTPDSEPLDEVVPNIGALAGAARSSGVPVVYSAQPSGQTPEQRGLQLEWWGPGVSDPDQEAIIGELAPGPEDVVLTKWRYSAFQRTELREMMRAWGRDQLVITGIYAHIGCLMTAAEAFQQEVRAFFVADAVADFSEQDHRMAVSYAAKRCAVVRSANRVLAELVGEHTAAV